MRRIYIFILLALSLVFIVPIKVLATPIDINAKSYMLIDAKTGQILCEHNADEKLFPASTTKILTAILALENGSIDQLMTASTEAVYDIGKDGMNIGIMPGEELLMEDLLNALLIQSANETANIIAENLADTRQDFMDMMNSKAASIGANNTHYTNPCGAHEDNHYTTARDMSKIAQYAMNILEFREIVIKESYEMKPTNKHDSWGSLIYSTNKLLRDTSIDEFEVTGIKTGYTNPAGFNLIASAQKDGLELISIVMGVDPSNSSDNVYKHSYSLLSYGFENFKTVNIVEKGKIFDTVPVQCMDEERPLNLISNSNITILTATNGKGPLIKEERNIRPLKAPVNKGDIVGYVEYWVNGINAGKATLLAEDSIYQNLPESSLMNVEQSESYSMPKAIKVLIFSALGMVFAIILLKIYIMLHNKKIRKKRLNK